MEKIYNNLNIENLKKTEWFNQFNHDQKLEILRGLEEGLDVSIYAKEIFSDKQMEEIRLGLLDNLNVSYYAKSEYDWMKMRGLRTTLKYGKDVFK